MSTSPAPTGFTDWTGGWARNDETLEVSASSDGSARLASRLDLVLAN